MIKNDRDKVSGLIGEWEEVQNDSTINGVITRTAAVLTRFGDLPKPVMQALNSVRAPDGNVYGHNVMMIVGYLRSLIEREGEALGEVLERKP